VLSEGAIEVEEKELGIDLSMYIVLRSMGREGCEREGPA